MKAETKIESFVFRPLVAVVVLFVMLSSCINKNNYPEKLHIICSAEKLSPDGKKLVAENDSSIMISGANHRTNNVSRTGEYSIVTGVKTRFSFSVSIPNVGPDYYFVVSIWRKSKAPVAKLVVSTSKTSQFYKMTSKAVETDSAGWEKLMLEFYLPPNIKRQEIKINVWNNGEEDAYFDDLEIFVSKKRKFPNYKGETFHIELDTSEYLKLQEVRKRAFNVGLLQSTDDDWVKGFVFSENKAMKARLRLKGDWLDHQHGDKWSFRIKLKNDNTWKRMKVFSVQSPMARMGVNEWYLHKVYLSEGILTTRYGFVPLSFKGNELGLYAWEEHFTKQLLESQQRREGPILRFLEDAMWDTRTFNEERKRNYKKTPYFAAAVIKPFSPSKIIEDSLKMQQFEIAQNLVYQYKTRNATAGMIFNLDVLAGFFATADVFFARHSLIWHNQRFYYNPVLCKLEPIAFDCFSDIGLGEMAGRKIWGNINTHSRGVAGDEYLMLRELFNDTTFVNKYIFYLEKYSSKNYLDSIATLFLDEAVVYDSLMKMEFPDYVFDTSQLYLNADNVRDEIAIFKENFKKRKKENLLWVNQSVAKPVLDSILDDAFLPNLVHCYQQSSSEDSLVFKIKNFFPQQLVILGFGNGKKIIDRFLVPSPELSSYGFKDNEFVVRIENIDVNYIFFTRKGGNQIISTEIFKWKEPDNSPSPLQELIASYPFESNIELFNVDGRNIVFKQGNIKVKKPLIIPEGYTVIIKEGTTIDILNSAMFITFSKVLIMGESDNPVKITSSDFSANGFTVLQAEGKSIINNVIFENLNTLNYKGWTLTGAVTFYESDVEIENTLFYRNQCEDALNIIRSDFKVENSSFDYIFADAFDSDFSVGEVLNTIFTNIGNDAIDFSGSDILIADTKMYDVSDKGISGGEDSRLIVRNCVVERANIGIASKDLSTVIVESTKLKDCNYGIVLLKKKPEYGPAIMILKDVEFINAKTEKLIEEGSVVTENGKRIEGKIKNVADMFY